MPQPFNPYSFNQTPGFTPIDFYKNATGINFSTGKRDQNAFDYVAQMSSVKPGDLIGTTPKAELDTIPKFGTPGSGTSVDDYKKFTQDLTKDLFKYDTLSKALNIGAGTLASAALMPFVKDLRKTDYELGLMADIYSPTKQAQRNLALQQQISSATDPAVAIMDAMSRARQSARSSRA
jgi:hypothetical protein